jgi:hypothetical protein
MTATIEDDLRAGLQAWAEGVHPSPGDPDDAMYRPVPAAPPGLRGRPVLWVATAAAAAALAVVAVQARAVPPPIQPGASAPPAPAVPSLAAPPVVFRPPDPAWNLAGFARRRWSTGAGTTFAFAHPDGRRFDLSLYEAGSRTPGSVLRPEENLTVRGLPAFATAEGPPRYRLDWNEAGRTWEVDGRPFASLADFAATMDGFAVVDRATWDAWLPAELAEALRSHPDETVEWSQIRGLQVSPPIADGAGMVVMPYQPG